MWSLRALFPTQKIVMKNNVFKPILFSILVSCLVSFLLKFLGVANAYDNHWLYSLAYLSVLSVIINLFYIQKMDGKSFVSLIQGASIARFLLSGVAFFVYSLLFPDFNISIVMHFMLHYFIFTFFEILFLLKIVHSKTDTHEEY